MIGLVLATHGTLGEALILSMNVILGEQAQVEPLSLQVEDDIEEASRRLNEAVKEADTGDGVLILTDMLGGTPSNLSLALLGAYLVLAPKPWSAGATWWRWSPPARTATGRTSRAGRWPTTSCWAGCGPRT